MAPGRPGRGLQQPLPEHRVGDGGQGLEHCWPDRVRQAANRAVGEQHVGDGGERQGEQVATTVVAAELAADAQVRAAGRVEGVPVASPRV